MAIDFKALAAKAAAVKDMTQATTGGGDYTPPAEGPCKLRFIGYVELGKHEKTFKGTTKTHDMVRLIFEVSGVKYPPVEVDGVKYPIRISIDEKVSLNEKAWFYKLFTRMNYAGKATHMAQLLGDAYKGEIIHRKYAKAGDPKDDPSKWTGVAAELFKKDSGYTIAPPRFQPMDDEGNPVGEVKVLPVDPPISEIRCFIWDFADLEQWKGIFIDGKYDDRKDATGKVTHPGKSKNVLQAKIMTAKNFKGSVIAQALAAAGQKIDIPDVDDRDAGPAQDDEPSAPAAADPRPTPTGEAADDALNGIVPR